jgi:AAHS family benzoate transporter-like MFS transporter
MPPTAARSALLVTALCRVIVVFDGHDLIVYGTVLPESLHERGWGLTSGSAGLLGSLPFVGTLVGAPGPGLLADRIGRRRAILLSTVWSSLFTALCAAAQNPAMFGAFRFLAGAGLGA